MRDANPSGEPDANNVDDSSPNSGLSGSTLNNGSPPSEQHGIDSSLPTAAGSSMDIHDQHYPLSPIAYYDHFDHDDSADEQEQLIEAAEEEESGSSMESRALSAAVFYEIPSPPPEPASAVSCNVSQRWSHRRGTERTRPPYALRFPLCLRRSILPPYP